MKEMIFCLPVLNVHQSIRCAFIKKQEGSVSPGGYALHSPHLTAQCLGLTSALVPAHAGPGKQQVPTQVTEYLTPTWETWIELLAPSSQLLLWPRHSCCKHLGSVQVHGSARVLSPSASASQTNKNVYYICVHVQVYAHILILYTHVHLNHYLYIKGLFFNINSCIHWSNLTLCLNFLETSSVRCS